MYLQNGFSLTDPSAFDEQGQLTIDRYYGFRLGSDGNTRYEWRLRSQHSEVAIIGSGSWRWEYRWVADIIWPLSNHPLSVTSHWRLRRFRQRYWLPLKRDGDQLYVLEWSEIAQIRSWRYRLRDFIPPRVQFYEVLPIDWTTMVSRNQGRPSRWKNDDDSDGINNTDDISLTVTPNGVYW